MIRLNIETEGEKTWIFQLDWWSTSLPQIIKSDISTVSGKGTCGRSAGEMEDVHNGLFRFCM